MPPKISSSRKKKKGPVETEHDLEVLKNELYKEEVSIILFEHCNHCPVFKVRALEIFQQIVETYSSRVIKLIRNKMHPDEPRKGAFEIYALKDARSEPQIIWSGIELGPPRREKFPESQDLEKIIQKIGLALELQPTEI